VQLVACGHTTPDWNRRFLGALGCWDLMDHLSIHRYYSRGHQTDFTEEEYYGLFAEASYVEDDLRATAGALDDLVRGGRFIGIILDEWGVWHPQAQQGLEQINTHRDALAAAAVLDTLNRWSARVTMANLAQTINVLQCLIHTDGPRLWKTPTYHLFDLYQAHMGNSAVETLVDCPTLSTRRSDGRTLDLPLVSASASVSADGERLALTLTNRSLTEPAIVKLDWVGLPKPKTLRARCLSASDPAAHNTADKPDAVRAKRLTLTPAEVGRALTLPVMSVTALETTD
jgi:alpha-N-arabinofuranosidase